MLWSLEAWSLRSVLAWGFLGYMGACVADEVLPQGITCFVNDWGEHVYLSLPTPREERVIKLFDLLFRTALSSIGL